MGLVQSQAKPKSWPTKVPVGAKNIEFAPKWIKNQRFGMNIRPNESHGLSEAVWNYSISIEYHRAGPETAL